jgi:hypothetical protein
MMAVLKTTRSNPSAQPSPNTRKPRVSGAPQPQLKSSRRRSRPPLKAELFDTLRHLNRGYDVALTALHRLGYQVRVPGQAILSANCLRDLQNRTVALRALANRDLLRLLVRREERDASRFGHLCGDSARDSNRNRRS